MERKDRLGGNALKLHTTWRGGLVKPRLDALIRKVHRQRPDHHPLQGHGGRGVRGGGQLHYDPVHRRRPSTTGWWSSPSAPNPAARRHVPLQAEPQRPPLPGPGSGDHREERAPEEGPGRGLHPVRRLPHPGAALLQQGLLRPFGGERHQAESDEPGDGRLYPLPGYAHLRRTGDLSTSGPGNWG